MNRTLRAAKFLVTGPLILGLLVVINLMTSPGHWWVQWAALGIGIAWVISLIRVIGAIMLVGGLAALLGYLLKSQPLPARWSAPQTPCNRPSDESPDREDIVI